MKTFHRHWALPVLCVLLNLGLLQSRAAADVKATVRITAEAPDPNPATPGGVPVQVQLQGAVSLNGKDNNNKECVIDSGSENWNWSLDMNTLQFSADGTSFAAATPSPANPTFSYKPPTSTTDTQHSKSDHPLLIVATTTATTPGYWKITIKAAVTFTSKNCGPGAADNTRDIVIAVGKVPAEDFDLSVSPDPVSVAQGTGGTTQVTVTSKNGFSGDVTVSLSVASPGVMGEFYDPNPDYAVPGPGAATAVVHLDSGDSDTLTLTLCVDPTATLGNHTLTVQGVSGKISHTKDFTLAVTTAPPTGGNSYPGPGTQYTVPGGIGRKIETTSSIFNGLSASITLPQSDSNNSNLVQCNGSGDGGFVYTGGDVTGSAMDAGLQLGHTGNATWKSDIADSGGGYYVDTTGAKINPPPILVPGTGTVTIRFETPGYQRQADEPALGAPIVVKGVVQPGYIILSLNGTERYWKDTLWHTNAANVKRCSTIAQNVPTDPADPKHEIGNGAGGGFNVNGSKMLNGAWNNVLMYDAADPAGRDFFGTDETYPGAPYVGWSPAGFSKYNNENGIDLSTVPLPKDDTKNPQ